jgi:hypothetical protein
VRSSVFPFPSPHRTDLSIYTAAELAKREGRVDIDSNATGSVAPEGMQVDGEASRSATATPAPDTKESSYAGLDEDKEAKDLKDLEEEEKKEVILSEAFEVAVRFIPRPPFPLLLADSPLRPARQPEARGELYMFQFPRKFPNFVPSTASDSPSDIEVEDVKADPDAPAPRRKPAPPQWGRFGSRQEKAARWSEEAGQIGELCVHKSGKVTLRLNGDLLYEVRCCRFRPVSMKLTFPAVSFLSSSSPFLIPLYVVSLPPRRSFFFSYSLFRSSPPPNPPSSKKSPSSTTPNPKRSVPTRPPLPPLLPPNPTPTRRTTHPPPPRRRRRSARRRRRRRTSTCPLLTR